LYDLFMLPLEVLVLRKHRRAVLARARSYPRVLEVGVGTGSNLPYYVPGPGSTWPARARPSRPTDMVAASPGGEHEGPREVVAIDISRYMLSTARVKAGRLQIEHLVRFRQMDVEDLDFPDNSFDCVLATFVFCSVDSPTDGLTEIRRVLKPGGEVIVLEHGLSSRPMLGWFMEALNPLTVRLFGEHINRDVAEAARAAGFTILRDRDLGLDILREIVAVTP